MLRCVAQLARPEPGRNAPAPVRGPLSSSNVCSQSQQHPHKALERALGGAALDAVSRRALLGAALLSPLGIGRAAAFDSPYNDVVPDIGILRSGTSGRLRPCPSNYNCISTSSKTPDQYGAAWSASVTTPREAVDAISEAVTGVFPAAEKRDSETLRDGSEYARFQIKGAYDVPDEVEFLVRPTSPGDRKWEGDTGGLLVTYRSCAGTVKYLYPFLTPISDGGLQSKRLQRLREELGYRLVGCELVECFPQGQ